MQAVWRYCADESVLFFAWVHINSNFNHASIGIINTSQSTLNR
jgi:hypothetical protein